MAALHIRKEIVGPLTVLLANWLLLNTNGPVLLMFHYVSLDFILFSLLHHLCLVKSRFYIDDLKLLHFIYKSGYDPSFLFLLHLCSHCTSGSTTEHKSPIYQGYLYNLCGFMNNAFPLLAYTCSGLSNCCGHAPDTKIESSPCHTLLQRHHRIFS